MDQTQLQKTIAEYYTKLPPNAQKKFSDMKWMDSLQAISTKYTLSHEQIKDLGIQTTLLLLGVVSVEQYAESISKSILLPEESLMKMLDEIESEILGDVRSDLEGAYNANLQNISNDQKKQELDIDPRFAELPEELRHAIAISDYKQKLYDISIKHKLPINKMQPLEDVTVKFIVGGLSASQYENALALNLDVESGKAREIANDINESILKTIRQKEQSDTTPKVVEEEDDVPIPPYSHSAPPAPSVTPTPFAPTASSQIPVNTMPPKEKIPLPTESVMFTPSGINTIKERIDGITLTKSLAGNEPLSQASTVPPTPSTPMPEAPTARPAPAVHTGGISHDPYHEAIEQ